MPTGDDLEMVNEREENAFVKLRVAESKRRLEEVLAPARRTAIPQDLSYC